MDIFTGVGVAMITPFKNGEVDSDAFASLASELIDRDVDALIVGGSTGEPHSLTDEEKAMLVRLAVKVAKGRVPVIAGVNQACTVEAVRESRVFLEAGADALLVLTPYCAKCTSEGCYLHYKAVKETGLPVIAYNVPSRTGYDLPASVLKRLADENIITGVKQASPVIRSAMEYVNALNGKALYSGEDDLTFTFRSLGGVGVISVAALVIPEAIKALFLLDEKNAAKLQLELNGFINALFSEINPVPVKFMLSRLRKCENSLRLPLTPLSKENEERLLFHAEKIGLI
ncbi:MAG: 4-hydroxy-tetrahydrodipicolinate synthase [Clostridia bacterium]|nr:4-hydroxy-tetrahydrodipicolinate synthase [Clostridia bacterium]